jgi:hypothetical protein
MGAIEQLILDVKTWLTLLMDNVELPSQAAGHRAGSPASPTGAAAGGRTRFGSHPPRAA